MGFYHLETLSHHNKTQWDLIKVDQTLILITKVEAFSI
jgi:hypothetical protein